MKPVLLTDFGSTYTKLTAVDVDTARVLGTAAAYTTVQTDVNDGFSAALRQLERKPAGSNTPSAMPAHPRQADCG